MDITDKELLVLETLGNDPADNGADHSHARLAEQFEQRGGIVQELPSAIEALLKKGMIARVKGKGLFRITESGIAALHAM